jgi:lauroyl/myristoyl acyltransferase
LCSTGTGVLSGRVIEKMTKEMRIFAPKMIIMRIIESKKNKEKSEYGDLNEVRELLQRHIGINGL